MIRINIPTYGSVNVVCDSFAELRSIPARRIKRGHCAIVTGRLTAADGLGGIFAWNVESTEADNDNNIIAPEDGSVGRWIAIGAGIVADPASGGGSSGPTVWGTITGALSAQTDLSTVLSGKQPADAKLTALALLSASTGLIEQGSGGTFGIRAIGGAPGNVLSKEAGDALYASTGHGHSTATTSTAGFLSSADKTKLDNVSGTNTGDQTVSMTGDVTGTGQTAITTTIAPDAVTNAKLANVSSGTLKGRSTGGTGDPEDLTATQATALLNVASTSLKGLQSASDKVKIDGVASGATANSTDAQLRDRSTHTGSQSAVTISDFAETVDDRVASLLVAGSNITLAYNDAGNALTIASTATGGGGATIPGPDIQTFSTSGTWTRPTGARLVRVVVIGAGGGAGSGRRGAAATARSGGAGGAGGGYSERTFRADLLSSSESVTIGAGGAGAPAVTADNTSGSAGGAGGTSSFGIWVTASGGTNGQGGAAIALTTQPSGGIGTNVGGNGGTTSITGVNTLPANTSGGAPAGGAGGGSISTTDTAFNGRPGASPNGYNITGGAGGSFSSGASAGQSAPLGDTTGGGGGGSGSANYADKVNGASGGYPGGGGGGGAAQPNGTTSGSGGAGADGYVIVITYFA